MERQQLLEKYGAPPGVLTNNIIFKFYANSSKSPSVAANWILTWLGEETECPEKALTTKIHRVCQKARKLRKDAFERFKEEIFHLPAVRPMDFTIRSTHPPEQEHVAPASTSAEHSPTRFPAVRKARIDTPEKRNNHLQHEIFKKGKMVHALEKKLQDLKRRAAKHARKIGYYNIKNVKRREERDLVARKKLRQEKNELSARLKKLEGVVMKNELLNIELTEAKTAKAKYYSKTLRHKRKLKQLKQDKRNAVRKANYYIRKKSEEQKQEKKDQVEGKEESLYHVETKGDDGQYTEAVRFCVMELAGLDVATGKIAQVMETVGDCLGVKFSGLPSCAGSQAIVDEGQVLSQSYIREKVLKGCKSFGLHRDGTTRQKVKILETSVNTSEGESYCLGFSSVVSETGQAIADDTVEKLEEVIGDEEGLHERVVRKLDYFMNDRAANEKKSSRLLEAWKEKVVQEEEGSDHKRPDQLHCAAHVLLGFQTYVLGELNKVEWLPKNDVKLRHPISVLLRDAADLFGPQGNYKGMRNQWKAFCLKEGKKSKIQNFKDNRFNGLFEVAAQVYHHHRDFLSLLETHGTMNERQTRLYNSLKNPDLILLLDCLGLFFIFITGPFFNLIISPRTTHQKFKNVVKTLQQCLRTCRADPCTFFSEEWCESLPFPTIVSENKKMKELMVAICSGVLTTIDVQLAEVLEKDVTAQTPLNNLQSQWHFGLLDSSQKRRPHSLLHHHSSAILLKQTRK